MKPRVHFGIKHVIEWLVHNLIQKNVVREFIILGMPVLQKMHMRRHAVGFASRLALRDFRECHTQTQKTWQAENSTPVIWKHLWQTMRKMTKMCRIFHGFQGGVIISLMDPWVYEILLQMFRGRALSFWVMYIWRPSSWALQCFGLYFVLVAHL